MADYRVLRDYDAHSDGRRWGPWHVGDVVGLDEDRAAWVNRDSPGTLTPAGDGDAASEREAKPPPNRQAKPGRNRKR